MVCDSLHIICGNCGQDLTQKGMGKWEYIYERNDMQGREFETDVHISCENCGTVHSLQKYLGFEQE